MKKNALIYLLALCFLLTPLAAFAEEAPVLAETSASVSSFEDALYRVDEIASKPLFAFEYQRDEQETPDDLPEIGCRAAYVADPVSGKVFYEKHAHKKMYPASTTKLLTALLVLENCKPDETAVVSRRAVSLVPDGYVRANLQPGEKLSVRDLLFALLIPSANDAAFVLAEHVAGSVEAFAKQSNRRAQELGCEKLHFVNPNGIHNDNHYCTAYDLYLIAKACRAYDLFNEIVTTKSFTLPATNAYANADRTFTNTNKLLDNTSFYYMADCTGMKTGYTDDAGQCLVASAARADLQLISVALGGKVKPNGVDERFSDSKALLEYVYSRYSQKLLADHSVPLAQVQVKKATKETEMLDIVIGADLETVAPDSLTAENVPTKIDLPLELKAPIAQNQVLGTVTYRVDGLIYATNLLASHDVVKKPYWLYNLLVFLGLLLLILLLRYILIQREKERRRQELLRRRRQQQLRQRRQAQGQNRNQGQDDLRFRQ